MFKKTIFAALSSIMFAAPALAELVVGGRKDFRSLAGPNVLV